MYTCWRLGLAFCPVDASLPSTRIKEILEQLKGGMIVFTENQSDRCADILAYAAELGWPVIRNEETLMHSPVDVTGDVKEETVAYILFTSGSTGSPKAVQITHSNFNAFLSNFPKSYASETPARFLSIGQYHFDMTILDCVVPAVYGQDMFLYSYPLIGESFASIIKEFHINRFCIVPSVLHLLISSSPSLISPDTVKELQVLLLGAERPYPHDVETLMNANSSLNIINAYGPTEVTMCCTAKENLTADSLISGERSPIGRPFNGVNWLIETPAGWEKSGEGPLLIAGAQVMLGYIDDRATEDAFEVIEDRKYYRTGDIVQITSEGEFFYIGRADDEVKINGVRIHLQDVALNAAKAFSGKHVEAASVFLDGADRLVLFYSGDRCITDDDRALLREYLPRSMMPYRLIRVPEFPRLESGKVNRRALKELATDCHVTR